uniref:Peptidase A2 domain-containing protein n=1 Tax=Panagrolaimus superbus TaxID=310955 RepID=A0A914XSD6_9BILA
MPLCRKILSFDQENVPKIMISPKINGKVFEFILDTGAFATMANKEVWEAIGKPYLHPSNRAVGGIGGHVLPLGRCRVSVEIHGKTSREWLYIIENGMMLFGRNWIDSLTIKIEH